MPWLMVVLASNMETTPSESSNHSLASLRVSSDDVSMMTISKMVFNSSNTCLMNASLWISNSVCSPPLLPRIRSLSPSIEFWKLISPEK